MPETPLPPLPSDADLRRMLLGPLIGRSKAFGVVVELLRKAAATQVTVLLTGETGVGKERSRARCTP